MATHNLVVPKYAASANIYFRLWDASGNVFDFNDTTFKAIGSATTPQVAATERAAPGGTGYSAYVATVDLSTVNKTGTEMMVLFHAYDNGTPAATDVPILEGDSQIVQFSQIGPCEVRVGFEANVKSTAGSFVQFATWLEVNGVKVNIDDIDAAATSSIVVRKHEEASNKFTTNFTVADLKNDVFEGEEASPNFDNDRQHQFEASITENSNTWTTHHRLPVLG